MRETPDDEHEYRDLADGPTLPEIIAMVVAALFFGVCIIHTCSDALAWVRAHL